MGAISTDQLVEGGLSLETAGALLAKIQYLALQVGSIRGLVVLMP